MSRESYEKELYEVKIDTQNRVIEYMVKVTPQFILNKEYAKEFLDQILTDMDERKKTYSPGTWSYRITTEGNKEIKYVLERIKKESPKKLLYTSLLALASSPLPVLAGWGVPGRYLTYILEHLGELPAIIGLLPLVIGTTAGVVVGGMSVYGLIGAIKERALAKHLKIV